MWKKDLEKYSLQLQVKKQYLFRIKTTWRPLEVYVVLVYVKYVVRLTVGIVTSYCD